MRGLQKNAVACCQSIDEGHEAQVDGVVPGRKHRCHAERHRVDLGSCREVRERRGNRIRARPLAQVLLHHVDLVVHEAKFAHVAFVGAFTQVLFERIEHFGFMQLEPTFEASELLQAEVHVLRGTRFEEGAHSIDLCLQVGSRFELQCACASRIIGQSVCDVRRGCG